LREKCCQDRAGLCCQGFRSVCDSAVYKLKKPPREAGILPLNYARKRGFALQIAAFVHYNSSREHAAGSTLHNRIRIVPRTLSMAKHRNKRIPKLRFSTLRGIGVEPDNHMAKLQHTLSR